MHRNRRMAGLLVALALALGACGGDDGDGRATGTDPEGGETTTTAVTDELADAEVLLTDAMEDDENGWGPTENEFFSSRFADGAFELQPLSDIGPMTYFPDLLGIDVLDSRVAITAEAVAEDGGAGRLGVYCRGVVRGAPEFYTLAVDRATGDWSIDRWLTSVDGSEVTNLASGIDEALAGDGAFDLVGTCTGDEGGPVALALAVNGAVVGEAEDDEGLGAGASGVAAGITATTGTYVARFEDFEVRGTKAAPDPTTGDVIFSDDFEDPTTGWDDFDDPPAFADYVDGAWAMDISPGPRSQGYNFFSTAPVSLLPDHLGVEASASLDAGGRAWAGICVGSRAAGAYAFELSSEGSVSITRLSGAGTPVLDEVTDLPGLSVDGTPNVLQVEVDTSDPAGARLAMTVNGEPVLEATDDDPLAVDEITLCTTKSMTASADVSVAARYDDLVIHDLT